MINKYLMLMWIALFIGACTPKVIEKPVEIIKYETVQVEKPRPIIPKPDPVKMRSVTWKAIIYENIPYFALTIADYEKLSLNMNDLRLYIQQSNSIISKLQQ